MLCHYCVPSFRRTTAGQIIWLIIAVALVWAASLAKEIGITMVSPS